MNYESQSPWLANGMLENLLLSLSTAVTPPFVATPRMHLYTASTAPLNQDFVLSQFTEPTFTGYAAITGTWDGSIVNCSDEGGKGLLFTGTFVCATDPTPGQTIIGYYVDDGGVQPVMAELFPTPFLITRGGDFLVLSVLYPLRFNPQA